MFSSWFTSVASAPPSLQEIPIGGDELRLKKLRSRDENLGLIEKVKRTKSIGPIDKMDDGFAELMHLHGSCFRGAQFTLQNIIQKQFLSIHQFDIGKKETVGYDGKPQGDKTAYSFFAYMHHRNWVLNGKMGATTTSGRVAYDNDPVSFNFQGNFSADPQKNHFEADVGFRKYDMHMQLRTSDLMAYGLCYTQPITSKLGIGTEVLSTLDDRSRLRVIAKMTPDPKSEAIASWSTGLGPDEVTLGYTQKFYNHFMLSSWADFSLDSKDSRSKKEWVSVLHTGYTYTCHEGPLLTPSVKVVADTTGNIHLSIEEPMSDVLNMHLTGAVNPFTEEYDFGVGIALSI